ncbi:hypothetical protein [Alkalicoccus chagannorensis]|uniref:hypothetical protein n=1 Tax=Alkalicoccus chagannorensis TaxID=427072 RepID=UPI000424715F|nr:hypothetical protein [Alkalicoccus chagannorensis]
MGGLIGFFIFSAVGMYILYFVIESAVKKGVNDSILGQYLKEKYGEETEASSVQQNDSGNED